MQITVNTYITIVAIAKKRENPFLIDTQFSFLNARSKNTVSHYAFLNNT